MGCVAVASSDLERGKQTEHPSPAVHLEPGVPGHQERQEQLKYAKIETK